jgi:predicted transcriptional regulator
MEVHLSPETESRLQQLAASTGRTPDQLIEDAMTGYLAALAQVRETLDGRYDDIVAGRVKPIDGREFFEKLKRREDELIQQRPQK